MRKRKLAMAVAVGSLSFLSFTDQGDSLVKQINQALYTFYHHYAIEKIYVQFDKEEYNPGETIWFKAYATSNAAPSLISKILYVDMINNEGEVIKKLKLPLEKSSANGEISLPANIHAGVYTIRSYTSWMLNFKPDFFFYRKIQVGVPHQEEIKVDNKQKDFTVQFYPEGGFLVQRLTSLVAFKAEGANGAPIDVSGKITDSTGDVVAIIKSAHDGMGSFALHVSPGKSYQGIITANGITKKFLLPEINKSGAVMHLENVFSNKGDSIFFHISRSVANKDHYQNLLVCAQMNDHFSSVRIAFDPATAGDPIDTILTAETYFPLIDFPSGIVHFSVFNEADGKVLVERLVYYHAQNILNDISLQSQTNFQANAKNNFILHLPDSLIRYAVSVTDADVVKENNETNNMASYLLLSSDISNYNVHESGWYFNNTAPETLHALDILLMTNEWPQFDWQKILSNKFPSIQFQPEHSFAVNGRAFKTQGNIKQPLNNEPLFIFIKAAKDSMKQLLNVMTDSIGFFTINGLSFHDTANVYAATGKSPNGDDQKKVSIEFYRNPMDSISEQIPITPISFNNISDKGKFYAEKRKNDNIKHSDTSINSKTKILKSVTVHAKERTHLDSVVDNYATGIFASPLASVRTMDFSNDPITKLLDYQSVFEYMRNKIAGLTFYSSQIDGIEVIAWRATNDLMNSSLSTLEQYEANAPAFFVDEHLLNASYKEYKNAYNILTNIRMSQVVMIRIYQPGMMPVAPDNGPHGSIMIYLKNGSEENLLPKPASIKFNKIDLVGYNAVRDFSKENAKTDSLSANNNRATLYWNPSLPVDPISHNAAFSFYNNATAKRFRIIVEGMDNKGRIIHFNKVIE